MYDRLEQFRESRRVELEALIECQFDSIRAARLVKTAFGRPIHHTTLLTYLAREAKRLGFRHRIELAVWYELDAMGQEGVRWWRRRIADRFAVSSDVTQIRGLMLLERLLEHTYNGARNRMARVSLELDICERTTLRYLQAFAQEAHITYSLDWLVFLYAMSRAIEGRLPASK